MYKRVEEINSRCHGLKCVHETENSKMTSGRSLCKLHVCVIKLASEGDLQSERKYESLLCNNIIIAVSLTNLLKRIIKFYFQ